MKRHIEFQRLHNFRDLGGYRSADGRTVRWQALYRADSLGKLAGTDRELFGSLGIRTVVDLRYPWEIDRDGAVPDRELLSYANFSIEHRPYDQAGTDPEIDPWRFLADKFAEVAADGVAEIRQAVEMIATADGPTVFHCTSGKDRTGLLAALLLTALDVSEEQILADFALTELATARFVADWHARYAPKVLRWPGYGRAPAEVIRLALDDLTATYGSPMRYLTAHAGVTDSVIEQLRARYLEDQRSE
ncbi:tyrosine-protein phosphatase [Nocardia sp. 2]|uniref:Tyrosine-protein phosphatase n=1 Tax=Nocardia acididurans TaxID=2802282 RepID=A0ABS1M8V2_9NOCA|nr:tyrosine-protein phosphatase [Nocardia acididurans]MBL1077075.1 tyrosine-protein phosphatase [Nocardia acididurans]